MPMASVDCVNYAVNLQMCPCTNDSCTNRGICCECIQAHAASGSQTACMRGAQRESSSLSLSSKVAAKCATNQARNTEFCVCAWEPCDNKGVCCNCVRNHFTTDGTGRTACMK